MMASMLAPSPANPPGRISQLLPTVKCSNCNNPVPLHELGEHICAPAPPVPALPSPTLPTSSQSFVKPSAIQIPRVSSFARSASPQLSHQTTPSTSSDRSRKTSVSSLSPFPIKQSPLSRSDRNEPTSPRREGHSPSVSSPLRDRAPSMVSIDSRARTLSTASSGSSPSTARPSFSSSRNIPSPAPIARQPSPRQPSPRQPSPQPQHIPQPHSRSQASVSFPESPGIDTKIGGEAGMAGVGRRGFAAAAHAAVFLTPMQQTASTLQSRRENAPRSLNIDAALQGTPTPPLSAGSGYSTPSPGPVSPQSRIPSPNSRKASAHALVADTSTSPVSPLGSKLPFFDKLRSKLPTGTTVDTTPASHGKSGSGVSRSESTSSRDVPPSPSSGSEYGLAYADSTDYEDEYDADIDLKGLKGKNAPPSLPLTVSTPRASTGDPKTKDRALHSRNSVSTSSILSADDRSGRDRSNSSLIAQALGLSQTPPNSYGKMGSPPTRSGRTLSSSSHGSRSTYSRTTSVSSGAGLGAIASTSSVVMNGRLERAMETMLEDAESSKLRLSLSKSKSTGKQAYFERKEESDQLGVLSPSSINKTLPIRSNTVGVSYSPETKAVKLPTRARTERERERSAENSRKPSKYIKDCVRCEKRIHDGRWIQVDGGGILCERCWKNMYLPKCRRCDLPIEKQAVSSSDGQLKGKYHKDCFNCHECHKPFPDKTFYVFDGKPLCAYHYHEVNRSLCAAPSCGQPIEGPCAVSHTGDRYHPEHLSCDFSGCDEKMDEYWEIDGRMLCQRHAKWSGAVNDMESKAIKRMTRFIDLSGGLGLR